MSRMCFDSILLLTCYSSPDICFSFHFDRVTCLLLSWEHGHGQGIEMVFDKPSSELNDYPGVEQISG